MPRKKPIEKQTLRVFEFGNKPLIYRKYENYVSCGVPTDVGDPSPEWWDILRSQEMEPETTLVVTAHGDSMMPEIGDGDIVFIDTAATPTNGDQVLLFLDGEALIKEYLYNPETRKLRLIPLNRRYEVIEISKRSTRLRIVGVVVFSFHKLRKRKAITLGVTKGSKVEAPRKAKQTAPSTITSSPHGVPSGEINIGASPQGGTGGGLSQLNIPKLHALIDGKRGKPVALAIYCAAKLGLINQTDYNTVTLEFGDIGERSNYNKYLANPQRFSPIDLESTTNFLNSKT